MRASVWPLSRTPRGRPAAPPGGRRPAWHPHQARAAHANAVATPGDQVVAAHADQLLQPAAPRVVAVVDTQERHAPFRRRVAHPPARTRLHGRRDRRGRHGELGQRRRRHARCECGHARRRSRQPRRQDATNAAVVVVPGAAAAALPGAAIVPARPRRRSRHPRGRDRAASQPRDVGTCADVGHRSRSGTTRLKGSTAVWLGRRTPQSHADSQNEAGAVRKLNATTVAYAKFRRYAARALCAPLTCWCRWRPPSPGAAWRGSTTRPVQRASCESTPPTRTLSCRSSIAARSRPSGSRRRTAFAVRRNATADAQAHVAGAPC